MTSLAPARDLARRLGASLGLTEGLDGPTSLRMSPRAYRTFVDAVSVLPPLVSVCRADRDRPAFVTQLRELEVMNSDQGARSLVSLIILPLISLSTYYDSDSPLRAR